MCDKFVDLVINQTYEVWVQALVVTFNQMRIFTCYRSTFSPSLLTWWQSSHINVKFRPAVEQTEHFNCDHGSKIFGVNLLFKEICFSKYLLKKFWITCRFVKAGQHDGLWIYKLQYCAVFKCCFTKKSSWKREMPRLIAPDRYQPMFSKNLRSGLKLFKCCRENRSMMLNANWMVCCSGMFDSVSVFEFERSVLADELTVREAGVSLSPGEDRDLNSEGVRVYFSYLHHSCSMIQVSVIKSKNLLMKSLTAPKANSYNDRYRSQKYPSWKTDNRKCCGSWRSVWRRQGHSDRGTAQLPCRVSLPAGELDHWTGNIRTDSVTHHVWSQRSYFKTSHYLTDPVRPIWGRVPWLEEYYVFKR